MASHVQSLMNDLGFRTESMPPLIYHKIAYFLKCIDTLIVCSRTLGEDASLAPLLTRIDLVFTRIAEIIELHGAIPVDLVPDFGADLKSFEVEMDEMYTTLSNSPHSRSQKLIDVIEIIDSVVEDLQNFHRLEFSDTGDDSEGMEEKLQLFRNFIEFVEMLNVDEHQQLELEGFVIQVASVAVNAAHVCARLHGLFDAWNEKGWKQVKHGWKQIQPQILALLQRIRPVGVKVSQAYETALSISKSSEELRYSMELDPSLYSLVIVIKDFIDFLLWCLWETLEMDSCLDDFMRDLVRPLWGGLKFLRAHAHDFGEEEVGNFRMAVCDAGICLLLLHHRDSKIAGFVENFEMIVVQVKEKIRELEFEQQVPAETVMEQEKVVVMLPGVATDIVVGMTEDSEKIMDELRSWSEELRIIPIVGMAGSGKTTLALNVFNHLSVTHHFQHRAWCSVSQVYSVKSLLIELLNQICPGYRFRPDMDEEDLLDKLYRSIKKSRYLVVLDDVWDSKVWQSFALCFPDDHIGSRILLTSRDKCVIPENKGTYLLRLRSDLESLEILRTKLFPDNDFPVMLHDLGMQIAKSCKGLPMTVVAAAGLLTTPKPDVWEKVLESLESNTLSNTQQFINSSELSYRYLSDHLKLCFLSFGLFPKKEEVSAKRLYMLWIAEGLIHETQGKKLEDVAIEYMNDLVNKSLVIVTKTRSLGEDDIKTCHVHETIHAFCIKKAKEEAFSHFLKGYDDILAFNGWSGSQRLCIQSSRRNFKSLRLSRPDIHSLLFLPGNDTWPRVMNDVSFIVRVFKSLRVLHITHIDLGEVFPIEMKLLVELRYLAVRGHFVDVPSSIGNLSSLLTLIVDSDMQVTLPNTIWDLQKLRHLWIKNGICFPSDNLDASSDLLQLESCSVVIAESRDILERLLQKIPNVSKLKLRCRLLNTIIIPSRLYGLESLHVSMAGVLLQSLQFKFNAASKLVRLTLRDLELSESVISAIGKLPKLASLILLHVSFSGGGLHMEEEDFQRLRYFELSDSNILRWTTDDELPSLEKLVLQGCVCLEEIPSCLESSLMLEGIDLFYCSPLVESLVMDIAARHEEYGNYVSVSVTPSSEKDFL